MDATTRRDQWVGTIFSTWVVLGLFLDGWAHNAGKPEDFWTPWHAVMYSGLVAGLAFFLRDGARRRRSSEEFRTDPYTVAGFLVFGAAGVGDAVWHTVFGIEEDVAALLSPTHLALMVGGLLLVTGTIRRARAQAEPPQDWPAFVHVVVASVLTVSVIAFFLQFLSPFHVIDPAVYTASNLVDEGPALRGIASILLTNALLLGGLAWLLTTWPSVPAGAVTAYLTATTLLMSSQSGFEQLPLVGGAVLAGVVAERILTVADHRRRTGTTLVVAPVTLWSSWFAVFHGLWGVGWEVELWTGTIVLAAMTGVALHLMAGDARPDRPAGSPMMPTVDAPTLLDREPAPSVAPGANLPA